MTEASIDFGGTQRLRRPRTYKLTGTRRSLAPRPVVRSDRIANADSGIPAVAGTVTTRFADMTLPRDVRDILRRLAVEAKRAFVKLVASKPERARET